MHPFPKLELAPSANEQLIYCKNQILTSNQIAVLIIKPSNNTPNANSAERNIESIIGRFKEKGWSLAALKLLAGNAANVDRVIEHYPQPFFDAQWEDVREQLTAAETEKLLEIWGQDALSFPIYHPVQLVSHGKATYQQLAKIWHTGRGIDNALIDVNDPRGINTVSPHKDPDYGRRRLLLIRDNPDMPNIPPFFIVNGFSAELIVKFSRPSERIVVMAFEQGTSPHDLHYLREFVVGATNPHRAHPGSIRYDALYPDSSASDYPIASADTVGIENNIVHLSENDADARRELQLWLPELLWYPSTGTYAPDISFATWERLRDLYQKDQLEQWPASVTTPDPTSLHFRSVLPAITDPPTISVNMMAGGSGGRFFGYETPEYLRNKLFAPIVPLEGKNRSFLELQLARITGENKTPYIRSVNLMATQEITPTLRAQLQDLRTSSPRLSDTIAMTSVYARQGVPRIVPKANDLEGEKKFVDYCADKGMDVKKRAYEVATHTGDLLHPPSTKTPGHFSVLLHYIYHCLQQDIKAGVTVAFFHIGEDTYARPDIPFLSYAQKNGAVATVGLISSPRLDKGYLVQTANNLQLVETAKNLGVESPYYLNTSRIAVNTEALATFLAGNVNHFMSLNELQIREAVSEKMIRKLHPLFEIKPLDNYAHWAGQFAFAIGQISEIVPTEFVLYDDIYKEIVTFKTPKDLQRVLPIIQKEYAPYLHLLTHEV